jgi:GTP-binding protein HflX
MAPALHVHTEQTKQSNAILVAVQLPGVTADEVSSSLDELARLTKTLGLTTIGRLTQQRTTGGLPTVLGAGKLQELAALTGGSGVARSGASRRRKGAMPAEDDDGEEPETTAGSDEQDDQPKGPTADIVVFDQ